MYRGDHRRADREQQFRFPDFSCPLPACRGEGGRCPGAAGRQTPSRLSQVAGTGPSDDCSKGMTKRSPPKRSKAKTPHGRPGAKADQDDMNQATTTDFEREDMGVASKE